MSETCQLRIGRYEILAELGLGTVGMVYKARDPHLDRTVAIKTVRQDLALPDGRYCEIKRRFYQQGKGASRLNHPNIVSIFDVLEVDETPYVVMEYVEGQTLAQVIAADGPMPAAQAVPMALQVCQALHYAHERQIVHRNIKPSNILLADGGAVKVADFGIVLVGGTRLTRTGTTRETPTYMSPEQSQRTDVDGRSDLFSLGVVLYEALTGSDLFRGHGPSASSSRPLHPALETVIRRAVATDPEHRYPTVRDFAEALGQAWGHVKGSGSRASWWAGPTEAAEDADPDAPSARREPLLGVVFERLLTAGWRRGGLIGAGCLLTAIFAGLMIWRWPAGRDIPVSATIPVEPIAQARSAEPGVPPRVIQVGTDPTPTVATVSPRDETPMPPAPPPQASVRKLSERRKAGGQRTPGSRRSGEPVEAPPPRNSDPAVPPVADKAQVAVAPAVKTPPPPAVWGCLSVNAVPFARVFVDGKFLGETPKGCLRVPAGDRRVMLEADGRRSPERSLHVTELHTTENPLSLSYDFTANRYLDR